MSNNTANAVATVGSVVSGKFPVGGVPLVSPTVHQVQISGYTKCQHEGFVNFNNLQVQFYDDEQLTASTNLDTSGGFKFIYKTKEGRHTARLVEKKFSRTIDEISFSSNKEKDRFDIVLNACK